VVNRFRSAANLAACAATVFVLAACAADSPTLLSPDEAAAFNQGNGGRSADTPATLNRLLAQARSATAAFQNVGRGLDAGYTPMSPCVEAPGLGGMGYHFVNPAYFGELEVERPQALLYEPQKNGRHRLVGIEYIAFGLEEDEPPVLFGQPFTWNDHQEFWALHVWIWRNNPSGMFADFNPHVSCEFAPENEPEA